MIVTTWTCDRCAHQATEPTDFWDIGIMLAQCGKFRAPNTPLHASPNRPHATWCKKCVVKFGMTPPPLGQKAPDPAPTMEDMVREIVAHEIEGHDFS